MTWVECGKSLIVFRVIFIRIISVWTAFECHHKTSSGWSSAACTHAPTDECDSAKNKTALENAIIAWNISGKSCTKQNRNDESDVARRIKVSSQCTQNFQQSHDFRILRWVEWPKMKYRNSLFDRGIDFSCATFCIIAISHLGHFDYMKNSECTLIQVIKLNRIESNRFESTTEKG